MNNIYQKIFDWLQNIYPGVTIIQSFTDGVRPLEPFISYSLTSFSPIGHDKKGQIDNSVKLSRWYQMNFTIHFFDSRKDVGLQNVLSFADIFLEKSYDSELRYATLGRDVAFNGLLSAPQILNEILNVDYEAHVIMEIAITANIDNITTESVIDRVIYDGTVKTVGIQGDVSI